MNRILLGIVTVVLAGCASSLQSTAVSRESLLPPKGTPRAQVEEVYGKVERVLPSNLKQPEELHVYSVLPRLLLRVNYDKGGSVVWSEFLHLDTKHYPISAKPDSLTPEVIEHDHKVKERDLNELRKKIKTVPWGT